MTPTPKIAIDGVQTVLKSYGEARKKDGIAIADGLQKCAEILLRASQRLVPVKTGALKNSGHIESNGKKGFAAETIVVYSTSYAFFVHEDLMARHTPPTQAKFLSQAVNNVRGTMTSVLERQLKATTGRVVA